MPSLDDLLGQTMLGTAARGMNLPLVPVPAGAFRSPKPLPQTAEDLGGEIDEDTVRRNQIWRFAWDPAQPGTFRRVTINSRGMGMDYGMAATAYDSIEFSEIAVVRQDGTSVDLLLDPEHFIGAWWTHQGAIAESSTSLWPLAARVDSSLVAVFAYQIDCDKAQPLSAEACAELGDTLIPRAELGPRVLDFLAGEAAQTWVCVGPARYVVAVELVLHKETNNFVPGGFIGFARIHPHAIVWSNEDTRRACASILMTRPRLAMAHGDAMGQVHRALVVTDTNEIHDPTAWLGMPLPTTDRLYDYYETEPATRFAGRTPTSSDHPEQRRGEITLADARHRRTRIIADAIRRHSPLVKSDPDIFKQPRQGQFDNVHIAPRMNLVMNFPNGDTRQHRDVVMLNACLHDCTHMHVRWGLHLTDPSVLGWKDGRPNVEPGVPAVPENQTVFASFPNEHSLRYRAIAEGNRAGDPVVFCHHGLGYACDEWPTASARAANTTMRGTLVRLAREFEEPDWNGDPNDPWAEFYFRVRYCGSRDTPKLRSTFDIDTCMG